MKDITVTLDANKDNEQRLKAAVYIADNNSAHLTGVYYEPAINFALYGESINGAIADILTEQQDKKKKEIQSMFDHHTSHRESKTTFKVESSFERNAVSAHAKLSDLVVTGQLNPDSHFIDQNTNPEHIIMSTGRPVLVIPYIGYPSSFGETVLIGWDKSREAARAIADAIPLLKKAKEVHIFQVIRNNADDSEIVSADMGEHLSRHDINVNTLSKISNEVPVAETMLSQVSDLGADLIVMGAYGHSRLREYTLGGTTRTILNSMTVPVLMTH